ncbi:hypothetical protein AKJ09_00852 [Labilithrix luteola]|uniref:Uncharacterized protein n=1 Tax=Labilithrix luteola TaxID=1391654 RepID=A0A0K1PKX3_9BACT|nr:hypothetical protein AKJ09_00852 [Labilithrix luteola]
MAPSPETSGELTDVGLESERSDIEAQSMPRPRAHNERGGEARQKGRGEAP